MTETERALGKNLCLEEYNHARKCVLEHENFIMLINEIIDSIHIENGFKDNVEISRFRRLLNEILK